MSLQWLRVAAREHRSYVLFSIVLFALGTVGGVAIAERGIDLFARVGLGSGQSVFPSDPSVSFLLVNNTRAFVVFLLGALTLGLITAVGLLGNGILLGYVGAVAAAQEGLGFVVLAIAPHGVLELPALFAASAVAFRLVARTAARVAGRRSSVMTRDEWRRTLGFVAAAWLVLAVAAFVEIYVTFALVEAAYA
ncbi:stage II sporulation protein M [Halostella sp. JP-L12]|uniref:stage II sporulation protein M n=1 Tax=Halostella TaxID=1843185 RepID=UPI0013CE92B8|nr:MULTISPECIES: stage II sporulation protein M [Halostella]NHN46029.1 stage II sporulation protein M [Halostella sp. JP-L12]